jgi:hypothetical protein
MKVVGSSLAKLSLSGNVACLRGFFRKASLLAGLLLAPALALGQIWVQSASNSVSVNSASVSVTYGTAETVGDLNVVVVGWSDTTSSVTSVVDDNTNTYFLAGTSKGNGLSQAIYYAPNIVLPNNTTPTVTVTFTQTAAAPDVRILEYSGLSTTNPLDNWAGLSATSNSADSGAVTTSSSDLIFGAGTTEGVFTAAGTGFTLREITAAFGDIDEDRGAALPAGSYNATATLASTSHWVMQVAGFSTTPVTFTNPPVIDAVTPITPATGPDVGGALVTINGTNFQPGAVVLFGAAPGGLSGANCVEAGGTTITCLTPADAAGLKDVTVVNTDGKLSSAAGAYTALNVTPTFTAISPTSGPTNGTQIQITGTNFQTGATVLIGGLPAGDVLVQDQFTITANAPGHAVGSADVTIKNPDTSTVTSSGAFTYALGTGTINFIQHGDSTAGSSAIAVVTMPAVQAAGHLNVVVIGWGDTAASVLTVTDTETNTYVPALSVVSGTALRQVIYFAKNIIGDSGTPNQITVTFDQAASAPDVRVLEYSGLDTVSPLDTGAGAFGFGTLADSGACTTATPEELIVAGATVTGAILGPGAGFNMLDLTQPNLDNVQHKITSVAGSCEATASMTASDWVMQAVAFKIVNAPGPDFSVSALPLSQSVIAGSPATYTVTVTAANGFNSPVALTCAALGLPAGATCGFAPTPVTPGVTAATSTLTVSTTAATPIGISTLTINGTFTSLSHNTTVGLTVDPAPDFTIAASPLSPASVAAGASATSTITIAPLNGFMGTVNLSCSSITPVVTPAPTCGFGQSAIAGGSGTTLLTLSTSATTPANTYTVTVAGSGTPGHSTTVNVTVTAAASPDFTLAASALSPATVAKGGSATSTITIAPLNGFSATVNLTCGVTPVATRMPTCAFNPTSVANGAGSSTLTVSTTATTTASLAPRSTGVFYAMLLPIGGLALLGTGIRSSKKKFWSFLLGFLVFSGLVFLVACGGSSSSGGGGGGHPGTPAGTYTVTVTGTAGSTAHSQTVSVVVQ